MRMTQTAAPLHRLDDAVMLHAIFERDEYRQVRDAILADAMARRGLRGLLSPLPRSLRTRAA
jgi:hypothetical protein